MKVFGTLNFGESVVIDHSKLNDDYTYFQASLIKDKVLNSYLINYFIKSEVGIASFKYNNSDYLDITENIENTEIFLPNIEEQKKIVIDSIWEETDANTPIIITEGKTDWKHLKNAYEIFKCDGFYHDLKILFLEYGDETQMGDKTLDPMCKSYSKTKHTQKHIFIFDRDNSKITENRGKETFNSHGNNIYSFCIPKISDNLDKICIEFYYNESDIKTKDDKSRRLFIGSEFNNKNGYSKCGNYISSQRETKDLQIIDNGVFLKDDQEWKNNIALSKSSFTENIVNKKQNFGDFNIDNFKKIFDIISSIYKH